MAKKSGSSGEAARDRKRTEHRIITAVGTLLAREGFRALGVNKLAREAGVDKVLIYRYFGSLDEAVDAYVHEVEFWPMADELAGYHDELVLKAPVKDRLIAYLKNLARAIDRRPGTRAILAWELAERNALTEKLDAGRRAVTDEFFERFLSDAEFADVRATRESLAVVAMGVLAAVGRARRGDEEPDWAMIDSAIERLTGGIVSDR